MAGGILLALGASVCWALANVTIKRAGQAVGAIRALLWAQLVGGLGFGLLGLGLDHPTAPITSSAVAWGIAAGVAALLAYTCLFHAFERARLSVTVPIMSSWAVLSAGISLVVLGERVRAGQLAGAALIVVGVITVARQSQSKWDGAAGADPRRERAALWAAAGAAIGFGVMVPAIDQLAPAFGQLGVIALVYAADLVLGLPIAAVLRVDLRPPGRSAWPVVALAGFFETLGFACISLAGTHAPVAVVAPLASLAGSMTVIYAWVVLGERLSRPAAVGAIAVCTGVVVLSLG